MATKWTTVTFIRAWMADKLGRKRVHGTYRVLDGDHCKVLVRASTQYGRPQGNTLIGISLEYLGSAHKVAFFHNYNTNCFTYRMNKDLDTYNAPKLPGDMLDGDDANILASGIVEVGDKEILIEIGDKPYLLVKKLDTSGVGVCWEGVLKFESADHIPKRVATITEAKELVKDPPGMDLLCSKWWIEKMADNFKPPPLSDAIVKILSQPLSPLDHGYVLGDCFIVESTHDDEEVGGLVLGRMLLKEPLDHRATSYIRARKQWQTATQLISQHTPGEYKGLTTKASRYGYSTSQEGRSGEIVRTGEGVYVRGQFRLSGNWDTVKKLDGWYRLYAMSSRIPLGIGG